MTIYLAIIFGFLGLALSLFFIIYGIKAGIINKHIFARHPNIYEDGKEAIIRGIFYLIIGIFFLAGSIVAFLSLYAKLKGNY